MHSRELPLEVGRSVSVVEVATPALVLGSTQSLDDVDASMATDLGVDVVRRRSGGGAVLLDPGGAWWVDVEIGREDPLWTDDVGRSALWLGRAWAEALTAVGVRDAVVHEGPMRTTPLSAVVCFAGLAAGEVTVDGAKVVGISQRRTRAGARFQCSVPRAWDVARHAALLAPGLTRAGAVLDEVAVFPVGDLDPVVALLDVIGGSPRHAVARRDDR